MTDTAFTADPAQVVTPDVVQNVPTAVVPLELVELIGPGKKYATVDVALKSIVHSQNHITNLETETRQLRAELQSSKETLLSTLEHGAQSRSEPQPVDTTSVAELVINTLDKRTEEGKRKGNLQEASDVLVAKTGSVDAAAKLIQTKATELGLPFSDLQELAAKSPKAFLAYFDAVQKPSTEGDSFNQPRSVNTAAVINTLSAGAPEHGTYAWYQSQRKAKGDQWYFSPSVTRERAATADKMGVDKFFGKN